MTSVICRIPWNIVFSNIWHVPAGSSKGGQFAPKGQGLTSIPGKNDNNGFNSNKAVKTVKTPFGYDAEITEKSIEHISEWHREMLTKKGKKAAKETLKTPKKVFEDKEIEGRYCFFKRTDVVSGYPYTKVVVDCRNSRHKRVVTAYCTSSINGQGGKEVQLPKKGKNNEKM